MLLLPETSTRPLREGLHSPAKHLRQAARYKDRIEPPLGLGGVLGPSPREESSPQAGRSSSASNARREGVEQLDAGTLDVTDVAGHEGQIVDERRSGEEPIHDR